MELRWAGPEDVALVEEAVVGIATAESDRPVYPEVVRRDPVLSRYLVDFAGAEAGGVADPRHPFGVVAEVDDRPVGLAWTVFGTAEAPGLGFVSAEAPEVRLWVREEHRGRGIGRTLLGSLIHEARSRELPGLSIAVDAFQPAVRMFFDTGFRTVGAGGHSETMLLVLR